MRYFGGIGNSGCPTVTSAAARGALHWRRLQLSLLNIHASSGARRAALVALTAPAAQSFLLQWLYATALLQPRQIKAARASGSGSGQLHRQLQKP